MDRCGWTSPWPLRLLAPVVGVTVALAGTHTAHARIPQQPVTGWIRHNAAPLKTVDPAAPLDDMAPLRRSIGFTFDHGIVSPGPEGTVALPPPAPDWFERPFGKVGPGQFALDLRTPAPPPVRNWLQAPIKTRGLADRGPSSYLVGGTLAQWFDVIIHRQELTPAAGLTTEAEA